MHLCLIVLGFGFGIFAKNRLLALTYLWLLLCLLHDQIFTSVTASAHNIN
jgi:hypothetical protein